MKQHPRTHLDNVKMKNGLKKAWSEKNEGDSIISSLQSQNSEGVVLKVSTSENFLISS